MTRRYVYAVFAGLLGGSVAAAMASVLALVLRSPAEVVFNSTTVTVPALAVGVVAGPCWAALKRFRAGPILFGVGCAAAFGGAAMLSAAGQQRGLSGLVGYVLPIAAIVIVTVAALIPLVHALPPRRRLVLACGAGGPVVALFLGFALTSYGAGANGRLTLPGLARDGRIAAGERPINALFIVSPDGSKLSLSVRYRLKGIPGFIESVSQTSALAGIVHDAPAPSKLAVDLSTLHSDQPAEDAYLRSLFAGDATVYVVAPGLSDLPAAYVTGDTAEHAATGTVVFRGSRRPVAFHVEEETDGDVLNLLARADLDWADLGLSAPSVGGLFQAEGSLHIEVLLVAERRAA